MPKDLDQALRCLYEVPDAPEGFDTAWRAAVRREEAMHMNQKPTVFKNLKRTLIPVMAALVLVAGSLWAGTLDVPTRDAGSAQPQMMRSKMAAEEEMAAYDMVAANTTASGAMPEAEGRKIVRTADLSIATSSFDDVFSATQAAVADAGGYVENLYQYGDDGSRRATLSMRVPTGRLDDFLHSAGALGRVTSRSESMTDMTTQYVDNQARLDTLYQKRDRLTELMAKAGDVGDLIEIETAIADTQYQIDMYETRQRTIDREVDMSFVSLTIVEETAADAAQANVSMGERLKSALAASVEGIGTFLKNMLVFLTMALPVIVPVAVVWTAVHFIRKRKEGN